MCIARRACLSSANNAEGISRQSKGVLPQRASVAETATRLGVAETVGGLPALNADRQPPRSGTGRGKHHSVGDASRESKGGEESRRRPSGART